MVPSFPHHAFGHLLIMTQASRVPWDALWEVESQFPQTACSWEQPCFPTGALLLTGLCLHSLAPLASLVIFQSSSKVCSKAHYETLSSRSAGWLLKPPSTLFSTYFLQGWVPFFSLSRAKCRALLRFMAQSGHPGKGISFLVSPGCDSWAWSWFTGPGSQIWGVWQ